MSVKIIVNLSSGEKISILRPKQTQAVAEAIRRFGCYGISNITVKLVS